MSLPIDKIRELRADRAKLVEEARAILAKHPNAALPAEDEQRYSKIEADIEALGKRIQREERLLDSEFDKEERHHQHAARVGGKAADVIVSDEYRQAFTRWMVGGEKELSSEHRSLMQLVSDAEKRAQGLTNSTGGFTVPRQLANEIVTSLKDFGGPREVATVLSTASGAPLSFPTVNDTSNTGALLPEHDPATDLDLVFGEVVLGAYTYTSRAIKVGRALMQDTAFDMEGYIRERFVERIGRATTAHYTTGNGSTQPQGVVSAAAAGFTAGSGNQNTISYPFLLQTEHALDPAYRRRGARWMMNDSTLRAIKTLVDGQQRPLWLPGIAVREPDTILGYQYTINQDMANLGASNKPIVFGDFSKYLIRDVLDMTFIRMEEAYAANFQVGFVGFMRTDAKLLDTRAVVFFQNSAG